MGAFNIVGESPILTPDCKLFRNEIFIRTAQISFKILKERLANTGCSRFLLGKSKKTSNWLIGQLNNYGIFDGKGNLTKFGKKVKKDLKEFLIN